MRDDIPEGYELAPADFWIEDSVTRHMREVKPKGIRPLTDAEANRHIDRLLAESKAWLAEQNAKVAAKHAPKP